VVLDQDSSRVWMLRTSHLGIFLQYFFGEGSGSEIQFGKRKHIEENSVKISAGINFRT
jgi:hypothetical protein